MQPQVILITGASSGFGKITAQMLSERGHIVYGTSRKPSEDMNHVKMLVVDVTNFLSVCQAVERILSEQGRIDVLINNAGISEEKMFIDVTDEDWNKVINTNLYSVFCAIQEVLPNMISRKQGCIINISSVWGIVGASCESVYAVSKAGIDAITKSLAKELGPSNIRINSIAPGIIDTDMNKNLTKQELEEIKNEIPLERIGKTDSIAKCVEWLIEDEYTTGQVISINGGWIIT